MSCSWLFSSALRAVLASRRAFTASSSSLAAFSDASAACRLSSPCDLSRFSFSAQFASCRFSVSTLASISYCRSSIAPCFFFASFSFVDASFFFLCASTTSSMYSVVFAMSRASSFAPTARASTSRVSAVASSNARCASAHFCVSALSVAVRSGSTCTIFASNSARSASADASSAEDLAASARTASSESAASAFLVAAEAARFLASANSRLNAATAALVSSSDSFSESFARSRRAICALSSAFLRCAARYRCSIATDSPCVASYCATCSSRNLAKLITALTLRRVRVYSGLVRSRSVKSGTPHRRIRSNSRRVNLRFPMASSYSSGNSRTSAASSSGAYIASRDSPHSKTTISSYARYSVSGCGLSRSCSVRGMSSSPRHAMISWFPRMGKLYVGAIAREVWRRDPEICSSARPTERFKSEGRSV